jgi:hypothetical protein
MRDYSIAVIFAAAVEVMAGAALLAIYDNALGYLGLAAGVIMMAVGFTINVIQERI